MWIDFLTAFLVTKLETTQIIFTEVLAELTKQTNGSSARSILGEKRYNSIHTSLNYLSSLDRFIVYAQLQHKNLKGSRFLAQVPASVMLYEKHFLQNLNETQKQGVRAQIPITSFDQYENLFNIMLTKLPRATDSNNNKDGNSSRGGRGRGNRGGRRGRGGRGRGKRANLSSLSLQQLENEIAKRKKAN